MKELKRILCAEDEPDIQIIIQTIFESFGDYEVEICSNGLELLELAPTHMPDLIILDVMMPKLDGINTFARLKKANELKDIPVIFITAKAQAHEVKSLIETGALDVIIKPFDPLTLCKEIEEIWEKQFEN